MNMKTLTAMSAALILTGASQVYAAEPANLLSVHVLNEQTGKPAAGVGVTLEQKTEGKWVQLNHATTDNQGRIKALWPNKPVASGDFRVVFATGAWFASHQQQSFFPEIPVMFHIDNPQEHYHIPLLLSQYGYSTYRGS